LSGLSIKKKRYIENIKDKNVAINTYIVDLFIRPQNLFTFVKIYKTIKLVITFLVTSFWHLPNQLQFIPIDLLYNFLAQRPDVVFLPVPIV
jgi:hypothetical protein